MKASALLAFGLVFGAAGAAQALEFKLLDKTLRLDLSEYGVTAYHLDNGNIAPDNLPTSDPTGDNYFDWINKFQADASWGNFTALLRLDSALFLHAPEAGPDDRRIQQLLINRYQSRVDLEKVAVAYQSRHFDVTLGDAYVTFGRGLVLSLRKVDELGIDTTLRGVNVTGRVAGLTVNGVAGFSNIVNVDPATGRVAENPNDLIFGGRAEYRIGRWVVPGIDVSHIVYAQNFQRTFPQQSRDQVTSYSATLELPYLWNHGAIYVEYAQQQQLTTDLRKRTTAFYGSGSAYFGPVTLLVEYKDYRNYFPEPTSIDPTQAPELALSDSYTAAPTLERVQQLVLNNTDVAGGHARIDVQVAPAVTPYASMAYFVDRTYHTRIYDPYAGIELRWQDGRSRASVSGGYRLNRYDETEPLAGQTFQDVWHVEYDVNQSLSTLYSIELDGLHESHHDLQGARYLNWLEGQAYLSFKRADSWALAVGYEYYTEAPETVRSNYVNATASWNVSRAVSLRLFVGGQRAGIKCVNGVCRNYPGFDGARLEVVAKY